MKKILLGIYLAVLAVFCLVLGYDLVYIALGLGFVSLILVMNGWCEKEENTGKNNETNSEQE